MTTEITLVQNPIIKHSLMEVGKNVTERLSALNLENQLATDDTIKTLKDLRAELNKEAREFETQRKAIKEAILNPYNEFEDAYKNEIINKYKDADETLKVKINGFEMNLKQTKKENLVTYFNELVQVEEVDWFTFEQLEIEVTLSVSEKKYKEQIFEAVGKIAEDLSLISTEQHAAEMLVEYKKTLNASKSIQEVRQRKEAERLEAERIRAERTRKRTSMLAALAFVSSDIAKAYYWVRNETVAISLSDIENLSNEDWNKRYIEVELIIKEAQRKEDEQKKAATNEATPTSTAEVLKAPTEEMPKAEQPKAEVFEAKFAVKGTLVELTALSEFLKSNNYQYQNLD